MAKEGLIYFHQGWTDIINSLSLVQYYSNKYENIHLVMRKDAREIVDFFTKKITNCHIHYMNKEEISSPDDMLKIASSELAVQKDILFHGIGDFCRNDGYRDRFKTSCSLLPLGSSGGHFVKKFYTCYDLPYECRVDMFNFERDHDLEEREYLNFIKTYGSGPYSLYHEPSYRKISFEKKENIKYINLDGITDNPFSYVKIIENCEELHLVDSIWASLVYLLNFKVKSLKNKKTYIYWLGRYGGLMNSQADVILEPYNLNNFTLMQ